MKAQATLTPIVFVVLIVALMGTLFLNSDQVGLESITGLAVAQITGDVVLNSTDGTNYTSENLTVYFTAENSTANITDWRLFGNSIAVLNMPFTGGSNSTWTKDYSTNGYNGTVINATWNTTSGYAGGFYDFDGVNDYIALPMYYDTIGAISEITVCVWFKTSASGGTAFSGWSFIDFDLSEYYNFVITEDTGQLAWGTRTTSSSNTLYSTTSALNDGIWHHGCAVYDGTDAIIYVDGVEDNRSVNPHSGASLGRGTTRYGIIGDGSEAETFDGDRNDRYYNGSIAGMRVYHKTLSPEQIRLLSQNKTNLIVSNETTEGDTWQVAVTPNNGTTDGTTVLSNSLTIPDQYAPSIFAVNHSNITFTSALINWNTNVSSNSSVSYGTTLALVETESIEERVTSHSINISGLTIGTLYYYNVTSCTTVGCANNGTYNFTTDSIPYVSNVTINSTYGTNLTTENLTAYWDVSDPEGDPIYNITDWRLNGTSIAVLNMQFEGGSNSTWTKDYTTYGNNGTIINATWNSTGGYDGGGAYEFDGNAGIYSDLGINIGNEFTMMARVYANELPGTWQGIVTNNATAGHGIWTYNNKFDYWASGSNPSYTNISINIWYHVAIVYNGSEGKLYIDGQLDPNFPVSLSSTSITGAYIGRSGFVAGEYFNGTIDSVMIYNRTLSAEQIKAIYENRTDLIVSNETTTADYWLVAVTPNDGTEDGTTETSNTIEIIAVPVISNLNASSITYDSAVVGWTTNTRSNTSVDYGNDSSLSQSSSVNDYVTSHSRTLSNLSLGMQYFYNATSCNALGCDTEGAYNFTTASPAETSNLTLNSTSGVNTTSDDLNIYFDVSGSDSVHNITDWRIDGTSLAVLNMPFEAHEDSDTFTTDYSTNNNTGYTGTATWISDGYFGGAYNFSSTGQSVNVGALDLNTDHVTITAWVRGHQSIDQSGIIFERGSGQDVCGLLSYSNKLRYIWNNERWQLDSGLTIPTDTWAFVALVKNGASTTLYVNSNTWSDSYGGDCAFAAPLRIGRDGSSRQWLGAIDEVRIFNRTLSSTQIATLRSQGYDKIESQETSIGETWQVAVTPNDGTDDGTTVLSNNLTICTVPTNGMSISSSTQLCGGTYPLSLGMFITSSNTVVECLGTNLKGTQSSQGIGITSQNNVTVTGCNITNYWNSIAASGVSYSNFSNNIFSNNRDRGIEIYSFSHNNTVHNNTILNNNLIAGIELDNAKDNNISNNLLINNQRGVYISNFANNNNIFNNTISNSTLYGLLFDSAAVYNRIYNNTIENNSIDISTAEPFTTNTLIITDEENKFIFENKQLNINDLDNLFINNTIVSLNSSAESSMENTSANVTLVVQNCSTSLFESSGFYRTREEAVDAGASKCSDCTFINCTNNITTFVHSAWSTVISNLAPVFNGTIQNQTWVEDNNLTNTITLSTYFHDSDNDSLTYNASYVQNITVIINQTTTNVTFVPQANFKGIRNLTFNATDGMNITFTNVVFLNVTSVIDYPNITSIYPNATNETEYIPPSKDEENISSELNKNITFEANATWEGAQAPASFFNWFLNGIYQTTGYIFSFITGLFNQMYEVLLFVNTTEGVNDTFTWNVNVSGTCVEPTDSLDINITLTLCPGTYLLPNGIDINSSNIVITCNNTILNGTWSSAGIDIKGQDNVTIQGCTLQNYQYAIYLAQAYGNAFYNLTFAGNTEDIFTSDNSTATLIIEEGNNSLTFLNKIINLTDLDNIYLNDSIVGVNSTLEPAMNTSANVTLVVGDCNNYGIYYYENFTRQIIEILNGGQDCSQSTTPACTAINCSNNIVSFNVEHFDSYVASADLVVYDEGPSTTSKDLYAYWSEPAGTDLYWYQLNGTKNGITITLVNWTSTTNTSTNETDLDLKDYTAYYFHVKAQGGGVNSTISSSNGILYNDNIPPLNLSVRDGGTYSGDNQSIFANWSGAVDIESGILYYEYALGYAQWPDQSYNDIESWVEVGLNTSGRLQKPLPYNRSVFVSIRARSNNTGSAMYSINSSDGMIIDVVPPVNGSVEYINGYPSSNISTVNVSPGYDPVSGLNSTQLFMRNKTLYYNNCLGNWSNWSSHATQNLSTTDVTINLTPSICYQFIYNVTDNVNNTATFSNYSSVLKVDNDYTPPENLTVSDEGIYTSNNQSLFVNWSAVDPETGIRYYEYAVGTEPWPNSSHNSSISWINVGTDTNATIALNLTNNETYYVTIRARSNNSGLPLYTYNSSDGITVDILDPVNGSVEYVNGYITINTTTVNVSAGYDMTSGINSTQLYFSNTPLQEDICNQSLWSIWTDYGSQVEATTSVSVNVTQGYCYVFIYNATDNINNTASFNSSSVLKVDITPPSNITSVNDTGYATIDLHELNVTWTDSIDNESDIELYNYSITINGTYEDGYPIFIEWNITNQTTVGVYSEEELIHDETYFFNVIAKNRAGLWSPIAVSNGVLYQDEIPPNTTIESVEGDFIPNYLDNTSDSTTEINVSGENNMLCKVFTSDAPYYEIDGFDAYCSDSMSTNISTCIINTTTQGNYTRWISCRDEYGNGQNETQNINVTWTVDYSGPNITIIYPANNERVGGIIPFDTNVSDVSGVDFTYYNITNSSGIVVETGNLTGSDWDTTWSTIGNHTESQGIYEFLVWSNDTLGQVSIESINITVDNTVPTVYIRINNGTPPQYIRDNFNLTFQAYYLVNISYNITNTTGSIVQNNDNDSSTTRISLDWTEFVNITNLIDSNHTVNAYAINYKGNETRENATFIVDTIPPVYFNLTDTSNITVYNDDSITVNSTWYDLNGIDEVKVYYNVSGTQQNDTVISATDVFSYVLNGFINGQTVFWYFYALDLAGNSNQTPIRNFSISNRVPLPTNYTTEYSIYEDSPDSGIDLDDWFIDPDSDNLTFGLPVDADNVTVTINQTSGVVTLTPQANYYGQNTMQFNATDTFNETNTSNVINLTIISVPDSPVVNLTLLENLAIPEDSYNDTINLSDYVSDVDTIKSLINWSCTDNETDVNTQITNKILNISATNDWYGLAIITCTATDETSLNDTDSFILNITSVPDSPIVELSSLDSLAIPEDSYNDTINLSDYVSDVDTIKSLINWSCTDNETDVNTQITNKILNISATNNWYGLALIECIAEDETSLNDTDNFTISITSVPDSPIVNLTPLDKLAILEDSYNDTINLSNYVTDVDSTDNLISWTCSENETNVNTSITNKILNISSTNSWYGSTNITCTAEDETSLNDTEQFEINITPVNDEPILSSIGDKSARRSTTLEYSVTATDVDNTSLIYVTNDSVRAPINSSTGAITFNTSTVGSWPINISVSDGLLTDSELITLTITTPPSTGGGRVSDDEEERPSGIAPYYCEEIWECSDWTACSEEEGSQTRICEDSAECGSTHSMPIERQDCEYSKPAPPVRPEVPAPLPPTVEKTLVEKAIDTIKSNLGLIGYSAATILVLGLLIGTILAISRHTKAKMTIQPEILQPKQIEKHQEAYTKLKELEKYILHALSKGYSKEEVSSKLIEHGWPKKILDEILERL
ncbi:LamG-like jellyroll fold domain-containing protein [Nanoarchaeota archaeon]